MNSIVKKIVRTAVLGLGGALLIIAAMPFYRVYQVLIPSLDSARSMMSDKSKTEDAIRSIESLEAWFQAYPPLFCESARLQTRGWSLLNQPELAEQVASNTLTYLDSTAARAKSIKEWIQEPANIIARKDLETRFGRPTVDSIREILAGEMGLSVAEETSGTQEAVIAENTIASDTDDEEPLSSDDVNESQTAKPFPSFTPTTFPAWAAIKSPEARVRSNVGKAVAKLKPGTLLTVTGNAIPRGKLQLYPCLQSDASGASIGIYVAGMDLDFHPGDMNDAETLTQQLAVKRARLLAAIYKIDHQPQTTNPYVQLLAKVQTEKAALKKKAPSLTNKRNAATGAQRVDANDALLRLRNQLAALDRKEKTLRDSMANWESSKSEKTAEDSRREELQAALDAVNAQLMEAEPDR